MYNKAPKQALRATFEASFINVLQYLGLSSEHCYVSPLFEKMIKIPSSHGESFDLKIIGPKEFKTTEISSKHTLVLVPQLNFEHWLCYKSLLKDSKRLVSYDFFHLIPSIQRPVMCAAHHPENIAFLEPSWPFLRKMIDFLLPWRRMPNLWVLHHA